MEDDCKIMQSARMTRNMDNVAAFLATIENAMTLSFCRSLWPEQHYQAALFGLTSVGDSCGSYGHGLWYLYHCMGRDACLFLLQPVIAQHALAPLVRWCNQYQRSNERWRSFWIRTTLANMTGTGTVPDLVCQYDNNSRRRDLMHVSKSMRQFQLNVVALRCVCAIQPRPSITFATWWQGLPLLERTRASDWLLANRDAIQQVS
jgi:hypothetical protein